MENADLFEGARSSGEFVLTGNVRFRHGDLKLETQKAVWYRERNLIQCDSGLHIEYRGSSLTGKSGRYDKTSGKAMAEGDVFMRDSGGTMEAGGGRVVYHRRERVAALSDNPFVRRLYPAKKSNQKDSSGMSSGPRDSSQGDLDKKGSMSREGDTLTIRAQVLKYNDSTGVADADRNVIMTRKDLKITCGAGRYHRKGDSLFLRKEPKVHMQDNEIEGDSMRVALDGEAVKGLLVRGNAIALAVESATDSTPARHSRVTGDSLVIAMREGAMDSVEVFRNAQGSTYEKGRTDRENKMEGEAMVLRFHDKRVRGAEVRGSAKSPRSSRRCRRRRVARRPRAASPRRADRGSHPADPGRVRRSSRSCRSARLRR
jgi:lipopolysaccharide export system protein LptA